MIGTDELVRFRAAIARRFGLHFDDGRLGWLIEVLERQTARSGLPVATYLARLDTSAADIAQLAGELTVGETYFFRGTDQLRAVAAVAFDRAHRPAEGPVRILSAGCATGEEPYTIAIAARERGLGAADVTIAAIDLNPAALERARHGRYTTWALRETAPAIQRRWFTRDGASFVLDPEVRAMVRFATANLVDGDPAVWNAGPWDVVLCRNVLMYFTPEAARAVVARIATTLTPGGHLFLGHAETLRGLSNDFHLIHTHDTFYYQRRADHPTDADAPAPARAAPDADVAWVDVIQRASDRIAALSAAAAGTAAPIARAPAPTQQPVPALPPPPDRRLDGVLALVRDERFADALGALAALPPTSGDAAEALLLRAVLQIHAGELDAAEATARRVLAADDLDAGAHYVLALVREGRGDPAAAAEHDRMAAHLDPTFAMPRLHLGLLDRRAGEHDAARRELAAALALLEREDGSRILLFGGGFGREALLGLCRAALVASGGAP